MILKKLKEKGKMVKMKFDFDEIGNKDQIELMYLQRQMEQKQIQGKQTYGFNIDSLYNKADNIDQNFDL